jgi:hypothetical protein
LTKATDEFIAWWHAFIAIMQAHGTLAMQLEAAIASGSARLLAPLSIQHAAGLGDVADELLAALPHPPPHAAADTR